MIEMDSKVSEHRLPAMFVADAAGLDFLNSLATPVDRPVEWLASGEDLLDWLGAAGLVADTVRDELRKNAGPGELDAVAAQARAFREWLRDFVKKHKGRPLGADAVAELAPLNRLLARDETFGEVVADSGGVALKAQRRWRSPDALMMPIAESVAKLVCEDDFTHVKACEGHNCTLMFVDRTKAHGRRWCSMAVCGNRAKAQAHRDRLRQA